MNTRAEYREEEKRGQEIHQCEGCMGTYCEEDMDYIPEEGGWICWQCKRKLQSDD